MEDLFFSFGGSELLDEVKQLWEGLNAHHTALSPHFPEQFVRKTFAERKAALLTKAQEAGIGVALVLNGSGEAVGYCISTISGDRIGEIESLYVSPELRGIGLGDALMQVSLAWLFEQRVSRTRLTVAAGNEQVFDFYAKYGFYPAKIVLEQVTAE